MLTQRELLFLDHKKYQIHKWSLKGSCLSISFDSHEKKCQKLNGVHIVNMKVIELMKKKPEKISSKDKRLS